MFVELRKVEEPFVLELSNEDGNSCLIDLAAESGGTNKGLRPMQLLAGALASCISVDILAILKKQHHQLFHFRVLVDEQRRVLETSKPFESLHLIFEVDKSLDANQLLKTIQMVREKYCSVSDSMREDIHISFEVRQIG